MQASLSRRWGTTADIPACRIPRPFPLWGPKGSSGRSESPLVASAEAKPFVIREKQGRLFSLAFHKKPASCGRFRPPAGGRGTFPHGKVPKGCRGRPKGACLMAAPGPPVAKLQCTASLAGARPAGFTSVPGRATVAFKVGFHFVKAKSLRDPRIRLWRKRGLAQLIPSPGISAPVYPWSDGKVPQRQCHRVTARAPASVPCTVRAHPGTRLVAGPRPNQMACPIRTLSVERQGNVPFPVQGGSGGIPRPFEGGIGGRSESPLAGGATPPEKRRFAKQKMLFDLIKQKPGSTSLLASDCQKHSAGVGGAAAPPIFITTSDDL